MILAKIINEEEKWKRKGDKGEIRKGKRRQRKNKKGKKAPGEIRGGGWERKEKREKG